MKTKRLQSLIALVAALSLISCAHTEEPPNKADYYEANKHLIEKHPDRPVIPLNPKCDEDEDDNPNNDICDITWGKYVALVELIKSLRDKVEAKIDQTNHSVNALSECEYQIAEHRHQIQLLKNEATQQKYINLGKSALYVTICGAGLLYGN